MNTRRARVLYGYRYTEVPLTLGAIKADLEIRKGVYPDPTVRRPVAVSAGCHLEGAVPPYPDLGDPDSMIAGVCKRFGCALPQINAGVMAELTAFVDNYVDTNLQPISPDADLTFESWLKKTHYPEWRREELRQEWAKCDDPHDPSHWKVKGHVKPEDYSAWKHDRLINARVDLFKCLVGPIFKAIEEEVYKIHHFIKHVPVAGRPRYIRELLEREGVRPFASDYTSFEAQFSPELMQACEFVLYRKMTRHLPQAVWFSELLDGALAGENQISYRWFKVLLQGVRMSGEMCTSLGNGWTNLMVYLFLAKRAGAEHVEGVVEGDDGLFITDGPAPRPEDFAQLGMVIKLDRAASLESASFCGLVFDPRDLVNIADPHKVLGSFGWLSARYAQANSAKHRTLLRCKALSFAHQYPGCPVIQSLAHFALRATGDVRMCKMLRAVNGRASFDEWHRQRILAAMSAGVPSLMKVPMRTRLLMEDVFGMSVRDQLRIEAQLDAMNTLQPLALDVELFPVSWRYNWDHYSVFGNTAECQPDLSVWRNGLDVWSLFWRAKNSWYAQPNPRQEGTRSGTDLPENVGT